MNAVLEFGNSLLKLSELKENIRFFFYILASPAVRTINIVDNRETAGINPFHFTAFGFSVLTIVQFAQPIVREELQFIDGVLRLLFMTSWITISLIIAFKIFKAATNSNRTLDEFITMSAIFLGLSWTLEGISAIIWVLSNMHVGRFVNAITSVYIGIYMLKAYKQFWKISYGKIFLYIVLAGIPPLIFLFFVLAILGPLFDG